MLTIIKFVKNHGPYTPGDVAGFEDAAAQVYLIARTAELAMPGLDAQEAPSTPDAGDMAQAAAPVASKGRAKPGRAKQ